MDDLDEFMAVVGTRTKLIYYIQYEKGKVIGESPMAPGGAICWRPIEIYVLKQEPRGAFLLTERKNKSDHMWESIMRAVSRTRKQGHVELTNHALSEDTRHLGYIDHEKERYYILPYTTEPETEACDGGG